MHVSVLETGKIKIVVKATPANTFFEAVEEIQLLAVITNLSNISINTNYNYQFLDSEGDIIKTGNLTLQMEPNEQFKAVPIDTFNYTFSKVGTYALKLEHQEGLIASRLQVSPVIVAPTIRVDASQSITPETTLPDRDKRIKIKIRLRGVLQQ